jgi:hypothetical protein
MFISIHSFFKKTTVQVFILLLFIFGFTAPVMVSADNNFGIKDAAKGTSLIGGGKTIDSTTTIPELIGKIIGMVLSFVGAIFFLLILCHFNIFKMYSF